MSYETAQKVSGRQQVWLVELHVRSCSLEFGVGDCPATGTKCFNTEATCPVYESFAETNKIYKFIEPVENMPLSDGFIPSLKSVSITPGAIKVGGGLGSRSVASISFYDHPHSDIGIDPYRDDRAYDPFTRGTFWGKFRARNKYLIGSLVRIYHGYITNNNITSFNYANAISMDFYIESMSQPGSGTVSIVAKDPLKGADDKRALAPRQNSGKIQSPITSAVSQVITLLPSGVGDLEYAATGIVNLGGVECAEFTRTGDAMTLTTRGVRGTVASAHAAEVYVQQCLVYDAERASFICSDLAGTYALIDTDFIEDAVWDAECDNFLPMLYDAFITNPTPVISLMSALGTEAPSDYFWNERKNKIEFKAIKPAPADAPLWDDDKTFIESDISISDAADLRVSTVIVNFDVINPLGNLEDANNYRQSYIATDTDSVRQYGSQAIKTINSKFISSTNRAAAEFAANVIRGRFAEMPLKLSAEIDPKDATLWTSDCVRVDHYKLQDETGANAVTPFQITSVTQKGQSLDYEMITCGNVGDITTEFLIVLDGEYNNLRNPYTEMHLPPQSLRDLFDRRFSVPPDERTVRVRITSNGIVGGNGMTYQGTPYPGSIYINDSHWPVETPIIIEIESGGYVVGGGGDGAILLPATEDRRLAKNGRSAIVTYRPITVLNNGVIAAGGGGGGAGYNFNPPPNYPANGGGGAGYPAGACGTQLADGLPSAGGNGSLTHGGGGAGGVTVATNPGDATLTAGGNGGSCYGGAGGGGGGVNPGAGGIDYQVGNVGAGDDGTDPDGGDGGMTGYTADYAGGGGGGGGLAGNGGNGGNGPTGLEAYKAGGVAGFAINGIDHTTIDPLSTGVIIGDQVPA